MGYYMGDYYRGDPGFFGFLGKAFKGVGKIAGGLLGISKAPKALPPAGVVMRPGGVPALGGRVRDVVQRGVAMIPRGARLPVAVGAGAAALGGLAGTTGYHIAKTGRNAGALVKNRRMRVTNPKALRRAIRRCAGFSKLAKRVLRFTSPKPPRGRAIFKTRRRKR